ncbi:phosphatase PAP2 family protein [Aggregicoccus sp. 17bor-14]|uniref:phosphatase PAP2 family protein n=1 Tax=Myxococcaceae TaxID=31 RepID=UPI00129C8593|nr:MULTISPECIES: phosphatase PAP2 family protein [Myxococcaceae]MBF5042955.1 phosphatase PAP2 family protein [Simulacricoccus sp. 17bor-14]MRI88721.1 phosphatase PAP2 family protein [Aggregicoccus sp. 17bor-14]
MARAPAPLLPAAVATSSLVAFSGLARVAHRRPRNPVDTKARKLALENSGPAARHAHRPLWAVGKWFTLVPVSLASAALLGWRRGLGAGAPLALAGLLAAASAEGTETWLPNRSPPPGRHDPDEPAFPSGHTLQTSTFALTSGYLLWREGLVPGAAVLPLALGVPLLIGGVQVSGERHWLLDVVGGWLGALGIAGSCAALYEAVAARRRRRPRAWLRTLR